MTDELLTPRQAAALIGVHPNTVKRLGDRGELPFVRVVARGDRRYRRSEIERYLEDHTIRRRGPNVARGPARWGDLA